MDLSSSLSGSKEFRIVKRGYDPDEVDAFLDQIALGVAELKRKLAEANDRVVEVPDESGPSAEAEEIHRALILAQRAADEEVRAARDEAERIRTEARADADEQGRRTAVEVAAAREAGRSALDADIARLEEVRAGLQNDVVVLERHVDEQREVVQAAIGELQSLLDHPDAFRVTEATGLSEIAAPAPVAEPVAPAPAATEAADELDVEPDVEPEAEPVTADEVEPAAPEAVVDDGPEVDPAPPAAEQAAAAPAPSSSAEDDDDFLAELRKAMHDDEPLGPRDEGGPTFPDPGDRRSLFGRRR